MRTSLMNKHSGMKRRRRYEQREGFVKRGYAYIQKSVKISLKVKTAPSIIIAILGFPMAFIPTLIAYAIRRFQTGYSCVTVRGFRK
jgi:hypothetical protein